MKKLRKTYEYKVYSLNNFRSIPQLKDKLSEEMRFHIEPLLKADLPNLHTIRIGSKAISYWPYRFTEADDADDVLRLFEQVKKAGKNLSFMGHFNHYVEQQTPVAQEAIRRIKETGAQIRTQSPVMRHINDDPRIWRRMWQDQVKQGMIPYYMFIARDTGAQHYFAVPLVDSWRIFRKAYKAVSGLGRTVRGPIMSTSPGKVEILGETEVKNQRLLSLRFLQARNPEWVNKPFFARYDDKARWLDELSPAFEEKQFFFRKEAKLHNGKRKTRENEPASL